MKLAIRTLLALGIAASGCQETDPLYCPNHKTDPYCAAVGDAGLATIGGKISGLMGNGLVLQNNGGDDLSAAASGEASVPFHFDTALTPGSTYNVTVLTQPSAPTQDCEVKNGNGTAASDVNNVEVMCGTQAYAVGGLLVGLGSGTVVLANGGDSLPLTMDGPFTFPTKVPSGTGYMVTVMTQPTTENPCTVSGDSGTVGGGDVTTVVVNCMPMTYTIGGTISGLNGTVKLTNNGDTISVTANGSFAFPTPEGPDAMFDVQVAAQPVAPPATQVCSVMYASGLVTGNVTIPTVTCTTNSYKLGGNITGVNGNGMFVVKDNVGDMVTVSSDGPYTFMNPVPSGVMYSITTQPPTKFACSPSPLTGTVLSADITNANLTCAYKDPGIACGTKECTPGLFEVCCDPTGAPSCTQLCFSANKLACDSAGDCSGGQVCCATKSTMNNSVTSACSSASSCTGSNDAVLCDPVQPTPCSSGTCGSYPALAGYNACSP